MVDANTIIEFARKSSILARNAVFTVSLYPAFNRLSSASKENPETYASSSTFCRTISKLFAILSRVARSSRLRVVGIASHCSGVKSFPVG